MTRVISEEERGRECERQLLQYPQGDGFVSNFAPAVADDSDSSHNWPSNNNYVKITARLASTGSGRESSPDGQQYR